MLRLIYGNVYGLHVQLHYPDGLLVYTPI